MCALRFQSKAKPIENARFAGIHCMHNITEATLISSDLKLTFLVFVSFVFRRAKNWMKLNNSCAISSILFHIYAYPYQNSKWRRKNNNNNNNTSMNNYRMPQCEHSNSTDEEFLSSLLATTTEMTAATVATVFCVKSLFFCVKLRCVQLIHFAFHSIRRNIYWIFSAVYFYHWHTKRRNLINFMIKSITRAHIYVILHITHRTE